jgi:hypothetical protein
MLLLLLTACISRVSSVELKDKDLIIQARKISKDGDVKVRIFPNFKDVSAGASKKIRLAMQYQADSSFYLYKGGIKQYAVNVIPVTNGIKDSYEYLLIFNSEQEKSNLKDTLVYQDKYINGKSYILSLN